MTNTVLPLIKLSIPRATIASVLVSIDEVASSRIITGGFAAAALAIDSSWHCPCDKFEPFGSIIVLYPSGNLSIKL